MNPKLDCVEKVLRSYVNSELVFVDRSGDSIEAEAVKLLQGGVYLNVYLWYDLNQGLIVTKISSSKARMLGELPSYDTFIDQTEKYRNHTYILQLLNKLHDDIQKSCAE